jgi:PAP2 superfamily protein
LIATTVLTAFVPAIGVYGALGLVASDFPNIVPQGYYDRLRDMPLLRDGSLRVLDLFQLAGVVTFPSFHAASAVLYVWMLWPLRWLRPLNLLCNGAMLVATPIGGGHFFADVIAGAAIALVAISIARRVGGIQAVSPLSPCSARCRTGGCG